VANLEFMQFHPTCLFHPEARTFLISEAVRGEGAVLRTLAGEDFMPRYHAMGSLAPRDIVARAVDLEMKRSGDRHVLLDCSGIPAETVIRRFPNIHATCVRFGLDITRAPIPVVPAAHYMCGGVLVDRNGRTDIPGLYAVGEVACTGLHGANRLASNSLLEAVVFGHRVAGHAARTMREGPPPRVAPPPWDVGQAVPVEEQVDIAATWLEIRQLMWHYVGIVRSNRRLERARRRLEILRAEVHASWWGYLVTRDLIELRNLLTVAELIVQCAAARRESRGLHFTLDYPATDDVRFRHDTVI
jgi:L-aspartate oxidase